MSKKVEVEIDEEVLNRLPPEVARQLKQVIGRIGPVIAKMEEARAAVNYIKDNMERIKERGEPPSMEVLRAACLLSAGPEVITMFYRGDEEKATAEMIHIADTLIAFAKELKGETPSEPEEGTLGETISFAGKKLF